MIAIKHAVLAAGLTLAMLAAATGAALADEQILITGVSISVARPGKTDLPRLRKTLKLGALTDQEVEERHSVYVVKVLAHFVPGASEVVLSIGDTVMPHYGTFADGIFVKVYDPAKLRAFEGKPVKLVRKAPQGQPAPTPAVAPPVFPPPPAAPAAGDTTRKTVDEVLRG